MVGLYRFFPIRFGVVFVADFLRKLWTSASTRSQRGLQPWTSLWLRRCEGAKLHWLFHPNDCSIDFGFSGRFSSDWLGSTVNLQGLPSFRVSGSELGPRLFWVPGYTREIRVELQPYTNHCAPFSYTQGYGRIGHPKLLAYHGLPTRYNLDDIQLYRGAHHSVLPTGLHVLFPRSANRVSFGSSWSIHFHFWQKAGGCWGAR